MTAQFDAATGRRRGPWFVVLAVMAVPQFLLWSWAIDQAGWGYFPVFVGFFLFVGALAGLVVGGLAYLLNYAVSRMAPGAHGWPARAIGSGCGLLFGWGWIWFLSLSDSTAWSGWVYPVSALIGFVLPLSVLLLLPPGIAKHRRARRAARTEVRSGEHPVHAIPPQR